MPQLYTDNLTLSFSLREFVTYGSYLKANDLSDEFVQFALVGEGAERDPPYRKFQAYVDPLRDRPVNPPLSIQRDYDSLIGIADNIYIERQLNVYTVPHPTFALSSSIHLHHAILHEGRYKQVPYHHIPNFEFASWDDRHHINIGFPGLWTPDHAKFKKPHQLTEKQRAFWYENGFRPAIAALLGEQTASEWPATYKAEKERARNHGGGYSWSKKIIPSVYVEDLMEKVRESLDDFALTDPEDNDWARNFFVLHTIRGVKHSTLHHVDPASAQHYLSEFINSAHLSDEIYEHGCWYVDVGIEISSPAGDCVQWITASHRKVVQQALRISMQHATRITKSSSSLYARDLSSHLTSLSGFRLHPGSCAQGEYEAVYVQAYTTDKSVVYNIDKGHHSKYIDVKDVIDMKGADHLESILRIYEAAATANPSKARLEVRVPFSKAAHVLTQFESTIMRECLCTFPRNDWWNFRIIRLMAVDEVLARQRDTPGIGRFQLEALTLTAACVWLINGLHSRPDDGSAARQLIHASLPLTDAEDADADLLLYPTSTRRRQLTHEDEDGSDSDNSDNHLNDNGRLPVVPIAANGVVFFRRVIVANSPQLRMGGVTLSEPGFSYWFGMDRERLEAKYRRTGIVDKNVIATIRSTTNKRRTHPYHNNANIPEPPLFDFTSQGLSLPDPILDDASDHEDQPVPAGDASPSLTIDEELSKLWKQFVKDIVWKSPNPQGITNASYLKISEHERQVFDREEIFKNLQLPELWTSVYYKNGTMNDWRRCFDNMFPPLGMTISSNTQNYPSQEYYTQWNHLLERIQGNPELIESIRKGLYERIVQWEWIPFAGKDRMWATSVKKNGKKAFIRWPPCLNKSPAPLILLKPNSTPTLNVSVQPQRARHPLAEESEEESD
ncbi:hypothetical protein AN958_03192 [Leucoagaricus sp. SymC.cos]|nr:hypothetical protein AN958_03192 [Leucoagaricus sp. SymC.cos]